MILFVTIACISAGICVTCHVCVSQSAAFWGGFAPSSIGFWGSFGLSSKCFYPLDHLVSPYPWTTLIMQWETCLCIAFLWCLCFLVFFLLNGLPRIPTNSSRLLLFFKLSCLPGWSWTHWAAEWDFKLLICGRCFHFPIAEITVICHHSQFYEVPGLNPGFH